MNHRWALSLPAALIAVTFSAAGSLGGWNDLGLSGHDVTQLRSRFGDLYACTSDGIHRKSSVTADSAWTLLGFAGQQIHDVLVVSPETLLVARDITGVGADTVALFRTIDSGSNWSPFQNGLGATGLSSDRKVTGLLSPPNGPGIIVAATWNGIARSVDGGVSWAKVNNGGKYYFLASGVSTLWGGGESNAFTPYAKRSLNMGQTWNTSYSSGNDDRATAMAFDPSDQDVAFLGHTGGLFRTADNGASWNPITLPTGVAATALASRGYVPLRLYANGNTPAGGATLFVSDDGGSSWTPNAFTGAASTTERVLVVQSAVTSDTVFIGTGSGVLRYLGDDVVGIGPGPQSKQQDFTILPSLIGDRAQFSFELASACDVTLRVFDIGGREIAKVVAATYPSGRHVVEWNPTGLRTGVYCCELRAGTAVATRKALLVR